MEELGHDSVNDKAEIAVLLIAVGLAWRLERYCWSANRIDPCRYCFSSELV
jgi:hypothetical protein